MRNQRTSKRSVTEERGSASTFTGTSAGRCPSVCLSRFYVQVAVSHLPLDIWWLIWAVFLIAIVERNNLMDEEKKWFDLFRVIFELVSAFGGIGLSLGFPNVSPFRIGLFSLSSCPL